MTQIGRLFWLFVSLLCFFDFPVIGLNFPCYFLPEKRPLSRKGGLIGHKSLIRRKSVEYFSLFFSLNPPNIFSRKLPKSNPRLRELLALLAPEKWPYLCSERVVVAQNHGIRAIIPHSRKIKPTRYVGGWRAEVRTRISGDRFESLLVVWTSL